MYTFIFPRSRSVESFPRSPSPAIQQRQPSDRTDSPMVARDGQMEDERANGALSALLEEANSRLAGVVTAHPDISTELNSIKIALSNAKRGLEMKEKSLNQRANQLAELDKLRDQVKHLKSANKPCTDPKVRQLEQELEGKNESEMRLLDSFITQTKQLEETKISLEESKLVISTLNDKMDKGSGRATEPDLSAEDDLVHAKEREKVASLKLESLTDQLNSVKSKLNLMTEAEEHGKKAMDELSIALEEVTTEATEAKEQLSESQKEAEQSKILLEEARNDAEKHKTISERASLEAEESCQQKEEENYDLQKENDRLIDALAHANSKITKFKEDNKKLRENLDQALNEVNVAKEATTIARQENSQLKDSLAEKESDLEMLNQETEDLRVKEASARDNIKELKKLLRQNELSQSGFKTMEKDEIWKPNNTKCSKEKEHRELKEAKRASESNLKNLGRDSSLDMLDVKHDHDDKNKEAGKVDDALKGSIFDSTSPAGHGPSPNRKKSMSLSFAEDASLNTQDFEQQEEEEEVEQEGENDKENEKRTRKKKTLLKKFGSILSRKRMQRREHNHNIE